MATGIQALGSWARARRTEILKYKLLPGGNGDEQKSYDSNNGQLGWNGDEPKCWHSGYEQLSVNGAEQKS